MLNKLLPFMLISHVVMAAPTVGDSIQIIKASPKTQEYIPDPSYPKTLMTMQKPLLTTATETDPYDTHLHINVSLMKIDHQFTPILVNQNIGYAVSGTWTDQGWTGINQYFRDPVLGTCKYTSQRIYGMTIPEDKVHYDVNGKLTSYYSYGNDKDGYLYSLSWYDEQKDKTILNYSLNCATMKKDPTMIKQLIQVARNT